MTCVCVCVYVCMYVCVCIYIYILQFFLLLNTEQLSASLAYRQSVQENIDMIKLQRDVKEKSTRLIALQEKYAAMEEVSTLAGRLAVPLLCMLVCVHVCICVPVSVHVYLCPCLCVHICVCVSTSIILCLCVHMTA